MNDNDINKAIREQLIKQLIKTDINAEVITGYQPRRSVLCEPWCRVPEV